MKRVIGFILIFFIIYIIYFDINNGTLPSFKEEELTLSDQTEILDETSIPAQTSAIPFQEVEVKAGDTVISLVEKLNHSKTNIAIETIVKDFETLNPGVKATSLSIGEKYKIPVY